MTTDTSAPTPKPTPKPKAKRHTVAGRRVGAPKKLDARRYTLKRHQDPTRPLADGTAERFALLCAIGIDGKPPMTATDAYIAIRPEVVGKSNDYIRSRASVYRNTQHIADRIEHLKEALCKAQILSISRRKQLLSRLAEEVIESDPADYLHAGGDGSYVTFGPESPRRLSIASLKSKTIVTGEGSADGAIVTDITFVPKMVGVQAIKELNAMDHVYETAHVGEGVTVSFIVQSDAFSKRVAAPVDAPVIDVQAD